MSGTVHDKCAFTAIWWENKQSDNMNEKKCVAKAGLSVLYIHTQTSYGEPIINCKK